MDKSRPGMFPDVVFGSEDEDFLPDFQNYKVKLIAVQYYLVVATAK